MLFCSFKGTQENDAISTEAILEFYLGPEETKTVQCLHDSLNMQYIV